MRLKVGLLMADAWRDSGSEQTRGRRRWLICADSGGVSIYVTGLTNHFSFEGCLVEYFNRNFHGWWFILAVVWRKCSLWRDSLLVHWERPTALSDLSVYWFIWTTCHNFPMSKLCYSGQEHACSIFRLMNYSNQFASSCVFSQLKATSVYGY